MGIQDRDYYREGPSFLDRVGEQGATVWLVAATVGVFFGQMLSSVGGPFLRSPLVEYGAYNPAKILDGEVWRLLTAVFLHASVPHIFFNMLVLYWAGGRIEEERGSRELVCFYLVGGVVANLLYLLAQLSGVADMGSAIGASGAVTAAMVVFACTHPHAKLLVFFILPMPAWLVVSVFIGLDALFGFGRVNGDPRGGNIAYFGHLGGAAFGLFYFQTGVTLSKLFARGRDRARPRLRVVPPPDDDLTPTPPPRREPVPAPAVADTPTPGKPADEQLEAKLDAVLEKVSRFGRDSLTPEEREILVRASELYKNRRK